MQTPLCDGETQHKHHQIERNRACRAQWRDCPDEDEGPLPPTHQERPAALSRASFHHKHEHEHESVSMAMPTGTPRSFRRIPGPLVSAIKMSESTIFEGRFAMSPAFLLPSRSPRSVAPEIQAPARMNDSRIFTVEAEMAKPLIFRNARAARIQRLRACRKMAPELPF